MTHLCVYAYCEESVFTTINVISVHRHAYIIRFRSHMSLFGIELRKSAVKEYKSRSFSKSQWF